MNTITIEFCAEDRARLDRILEALEKVAPRQLYVLDLDSAPAEGIEIEPQALETTEPTNTQPEPEKPTEASTEDDTTAPDPEPTTESKEPAVTLEQIQQKVVQLAAANNGEKKAAVREIIKAYGTKVSDLKDEPDKWGEVWEKLTALEG